MAKKVSRKAAPAASRTPKIKTKLARPAGSTSQPGGHPAVVSPGLPQETKNQLQVTLQASRRFWLMVIGIGALLLALVQTWGYFTGWGNPQRVIERQFNTAQRLTLEKRYDAAIRQYLKIVKNAKDDETKRQASIALADCYHEQKNWPEAIALYEQLNAGSGGTIMSAWTGLKIAECWEDYGKLDEAKKIYEGIREKFPKTDWDAEARLGLGKVFGEQEEYAQALKIYQSLITDYKGGFLAAEAQLHIGEILVKQGEAEKARTLLQAALREYPDTMTDDIRKFLLRLDTAKEPEGVRQWGK